MTLPDYNPENEATKRRFRIWLQDAMGYAESSIDSALAAIHEYEEFTGYRPFRRFQFEHARAYVREMKDRSNPATGHLYSKARLNGTFGSLRKFFAWLGRQPEFRNTISIADAEYFRLNEKDARIARATRPKCVPEIEEVRRVIATMPAGTEIEQRDRAIVAFTLLTGARVKALISAKIKHIDIAEGLFFQDAREVATKRAKTISTWFFPVGGMAQEIVEDWIRFLTAEHGFGPDDPLFPATRLAHDENRRFVSAGLSRKHWRADQPVRDIFRAAWTANSQPHRC